MVILGFLLLLLAYTTGIIAIVLEIICYRKNIEYFETIILSVAFLLVIFSISISSILDIANQSTISEPSNLLHFALIALALAAPLNIFAERQMTVPPFVRYLLFTLASLLTLLLVLRMTFNFEAPIHWLINGFLAVSVIYSMITLRKSKPGIHISHQEKIERTMSLAILTILPLFLLIEYYQKTDVPITISVFVTILATSKIFDNIKRLSLLTPENSIELKKDNSYELTPREQEVADHLVKGHTYAQIAEDLFISMPTVKTHVSNIYRKVGVKNKMELFYTLIK